MTDNHQASKNMETSHITAPDPKQPMIYKIRLQGTLSAQWKEWLGGVTITTEDDGNTLLTCQVIDQAALFGLLKKVRDLGLPLLSVIRISPR